MFWLALVCAMERDLTLGPVVDYRPVELRSTRPARDAEAWSGAIDGAPIRLLRHTADGSFSLEINGRSVPLRPAGPAGWEADTRIPYNRHGFATAPLRVRVPRAAIAFGSAQVSIEANSHVFVSARCGPRQLLATPNLQGPQGFDENADSQIDPASPREFNRLGAATFEFDNTGWRISKLDWNTRTATLEPAPPPPHFELGDVLPETTTIDRLKERRPLTGAWTLIHYWASTSPPSIAAFAQLKLISEAYNLNLLGINADPNPADASRVLAQFGILWPDVQATEPTALFDHRARVASYPTYLLLDPTRRIILRTSSTIDLLESLRRTVPRRKSN